MFQSLDPEQQQSLIFLILASTDIVHAGLTVSCKQEHKTHLPVEGHKKTSIQKSFPFKN